MAVEWLSNAGYTRALTEPHGDRAEALAIKWLYENSGRIYNFESLKNKLETGVVLVEVMGMPGAGKDTLLSGIDALGENWIYCGREPYSSLKAAGKLTGKEGGDLERWLVGAAMAEAVVPLVELKRRGIAAGGLGILNKGLTDWEVVTRARIVNNEVPNGVWRGIPETDAGADATVAMMVGVEEGRMRANTARSVS
jgi:hypothetical protein